MNKFNLLANIGVGLTVVAASFITLVVIGDEQKEPTSQAVNLLATTPKSASWQLVWSDEFNSSGINTDKWSHVQDCYGGGNNEQQCYTNRSNNSFVQDGKLNIVAQREQFEGPAKADGDMSETTTLPYTSARLRTLKKGDWTYGRYEIRAKLPFGQGTWPAVWMLPTDYVYGGWAASGEIDIIEAANLKTPSAAKGAKPGELESRVHGTLHYGDAWPNNVHSGTAFQFPQQHNPADAFHTYALEWQDGEMRWYIDDYHYATQRADGWYSRFEQDGKLVQGQGSAPYNQDFHLIINLAVGGAWASNANEKGIDESVFPQTLQVDYVRVYQCSGDANTGAGCETVGDNATLVTGHQVPSPEKNFAQGSIFHLYNSALNKQLAFNHYDPDKTVEYTEISTEKGTTLRLKQTGITGNLAIQYPDRADMSHWLAKGDLVFNLKVVNQQANSELLIKIGSGWPKVSDIAVPITQQGQWQQVRINLSQIINGGNRYYQGDEFKADISNIFSLLVIEPLGPMELLVNDIRFEQRLYD